ncbi:MAG: M3 family metallopeptidase [Betaproteobacteria bacterium]
MSNPLLEMGKGLPNYAAITAKHVEPAIKELLVLTQQTLDTTLQEARSLSLPPTWESLVEPLEISLEKLGRAWGVIGHLNSVADNPEMRQAHAQMLPEVVAFYSAFGQNLELYKLYKTLQQSTSWDSLNQAQKKSITNTLRDFKLGGAELDDVHKKRFSEIQEELAHLCKNFSDHILDATDHFLHVVHDLNDLSGLPEDVLASAAQLAQEKNTSGWAFNLQFPSYFPVQQLAQNRSLRQLMYQAYVTRASDLGPQFGQGQLDWNNSELMLDILKLRQEEAHLLGMTNYAELSLVSKMASTVNEVRSFLNDFSIRAKPQAIEDLKELKEFAKNSLGIDTLEPWDINFASEKLKQEKYSFSEQEVKQFFPIDQVLQGLFHVIETVLQVHILPTELPLWHRDVRSFQVQNSNQEVIAHFYLDAYARAGKRGGAWMDDARGRQHLSHDILQTPVAYLVCNFPSPTIDQAGQLRPATISHDDVITLFHEFGHGLHHMLTKIDTLGVSGINGVEWDAVELPSQFMENFCWDAEVLKQLSRHIETQESITDTLFQKMLAAKNFQNGLTTLRQIVFASFDWELHSSFDANIANANDILKLSSTINDSIHVLPQSHISRWPFTFSHIFSGGYAAGYYSYKWAEVLSADAFAAFEENVSQYGSILNPEVGMIYRHEILEVGGSRSAADSFKAFRGRAPQIDALLRHGGLNHTSIR